MVLIGHVGLATRAGYEEIAYVGMSVEEVRTRNADVVEVELGVVDSVETDFVTHIVNRHARTDGQVFVSMHTVK